MKTNSTYLSQGYDEAVMNHLQGLLTDSLITTGHVEQAAIIRRKDASLRASSLGLSLDSDDLSMIVKLFREPTILRSEGLQLGTNGNVYDCLRADKNSIYGRVELDGPGIIIVKTHTLIILALFSPPKHASVCIEAVENFGDYFRDKGK